MFSKTLIKFWNLLSFSLILVSISGSFSVADGDPIQNPTIFRCISGWYGEERCWEGKKQDEPHKGVDIKPCKYEEKFYGNLTEVRPYSTGKVVEVGDDEKKRKKKGVGRGKYVVIEHKNGLRTEYSHLDDILVKPGQRIEVSANPEENIIDMETPIGHMGNTGKSTWKKGTLLTRLNNYDKGVVILETETLKEV